MVVVGNKSDLICEATVTEEEGRNFAKQNELMFAYTSCKTGEGVKEMFEEIEKIIMKKVNSVEDDDKPEINELLLEKDFENINKNEGCCKAKANKKCNVCCFHCCLKNKKNRVNIDKI